MVTACEHAHQITGPGPGLQSRPAVTNQDPDPRYKTWHLSPGTGGARLLPLVLILRANRRNEHINEESVKGMLNVVFAKAPMLFLARKVRSRRIGLLLIFKRVQTWCVEGLQLGKSLTVDLNPAKQLKPLTKRHERRKKPWGKKQWG